MQVAEIFVSCKKEVHYSRELIVPFPVLFRVLSGECRIVAAAETYRYFAGDTVLVPGNQLGRMSKLPLDGQPFLSVSVIFLEPRRRQYYDTHHLRPTLQHRAVPLTYAEHPLLKSLFQSLTPYFELADALPVDIAAFKVEEAIRILRTIDPTSDQILAHFDKPGKIDLVKFMEENYQFNLSLDKFGYLTGRSLTTFKKDFTAAFGTTPSKWLTQKRLGLAHYQISEQHRRPSEVYLEVGFENLSHFSTAFKKQYGYNPTSLVKRDV